MNETESKPEENAAENAAPPQGMGRRTFLKKFGGAAAAVTVGAVLAPGKKAEALSADSKDKSHAGPLSAQNGPGDMGLGPDYVPPGGQDNVPRDANGDITPGGKLVVAGVAAGGVGLGAWVLSRTRKAATHLNPKNYTAEQQRLAQQNVHEIDRDNNERHHF